MTDPKKKWEVGDTLWAKEDYKYLIQCDLVITYYKFSIDKNRVVYTPLNCLPKETQKKLFKGKQGVWKSKLLMFRFMTRIFRKITNIRVERVQDITLEDVIKEGIEDANKCVYKDDRVFKCNHHDILNKFKELWDSINAKRGYGWDKNPWVWVIGFKKKGK